MNHMHISRSVNMLSWHEWRLGGDKQSAKVDTADGRTGDYWLPAACVRSPPASLTLTHLRRTVHQTLAHVYHLINCHHTAPGWLLSPAFTMHHSILVLCICTSSQLRTLQYLATHHMLLRHVSSPTITVIAGINGVFVVRLWLILKFHSIALYCRFAYF